MVERGMRRRQCYTYIMHKHALLKCAANEIALVDGVVFQFQARD